MGTTPPVDASAADRPLVSVVVPCWNAEASIERAISSVLVGAHAPLECVVVDDGSTDRTAEIVDAIARRDRRVELLRSPLNEGVSAARNRALEVVRGTWLAFLDADDRLLPGAIAALVATAERTDALVVIGQRRWWDGSRSWTSSLHEIPDIREPGRKSLARHPGLVYYASATGKLFHASVTSGLRFEGRVSGDQLWTIRALLRAGDRIEVIEDEVYEWTRPPRDGSHAGITSSMRASARLGVEVVTALAGSLVAVRQAAHVAIADPAHREALDARYVERILRADIWIHLLQAIRRRDPTTAELLAAIDRFVADVPPVLLRASSALATDILEPPLRRWDLLPDDARAAYRSLLETALRADPALPARAGHPFARVALRLVSRHHRGLPRLAATGLLVAARVPGLIARRARSRCRALPGQAIVR